MKVHIVVCAPDLDAADNCIRSVDGPGDLDHYFFHYDPFQPRNRIAQLSQKVYMAEHIYKLSNELLHS